MTEFHLDSLIKSVLLQYCGLVLVIESATRLPCLRLRVSECQNRETSIPSILLVGRS